MTKINITYGVGARRILGAGGARRTCKVNQFSGTPGFALRVGILRAATAAM